MQSIAKFLGSPRAMEGTTRYLKRLDLARDLDPEAFKPLMMPHFTDEQMVRQMRAMSRVEADHPELAPPVAS